MRRRQSERADQHRLCRCGSGRLRPEADFLAALAPITNMIDTPLDSAKSIASNLQSLLADAGSRLFDAAGDSAPATFIRNTITNSGMNKPGALAAVSTDDMSEALAQLDTVPAGEGAAPAQGAPAEGAPAAAPAEATA